MSIHIPVLLNETIELLNLKEGDVVVDATLGGGGNSEAILNKIGEKGKLVAIDLDSNSIEDYSSKLKTQSAKLRKNIFLINDNFANLENILADLKIEKVDAILADLGWSSDQLENRGMSFMKDEPLDMRLDKKGELTAGKIINEYPQEELEKIIREYGEEKFAKNIARKIVECRKNKKIGTTKELAEIIKAAIPKRCQSAGWRRKINPATKTFQAIRIEVNGELENLKKFIPQAISVLAPEGRLAIISFHSLEDRIVKNIFRENAGGCVCPSGFPQCLCGQKPKVKIITRKPVISGSPEIEGNPRSRSAKLRVCEKSK